ncbi:MAG: tRNA pseudouridine(38-40) synthase TruA [Betaproteobacteria bacterium]|nr:tRNA pseudouridine(38-40) synthase TruA [Betaproteobacteria bacterium]
MRIAIGLAYDGSHFEGWQTQPSKRGIQDHLEQALAQVADQPIKVTGAGRTDTGVHATGQVAHFDTAVERPLTAWVRGANSLLPPSIAIRWAVLVTDDFHARFGARSRTYRYLLYASPVRPALQPTQVGWFHLPLDVAAMQVAAAHLVGRHDFSSFRAAECQAKTPVRAIESLTIVERGPYVHIAVRADAFLHHMVRNIVGALVYVGKGAHPPAWLAQLLAMRDRRHAPPTFSAAGLYLTDIEYDAVFELPAPSNEAPWFDGHQQIHANAHQNMRHHDP